MKPLIAIDKYGIVHTLHMSQHPETKHWRVKVGTPGKTAHIFVPEEDLVAWLEDCLEVLDPQDD